MEKEWNFVPWLPLVCDSVFIHVVLLWLLTAACIKTGRPQIAKRAIELVEQRLAKDGWPEYYDGKTGRYVGKQARKYQTWSIAGYLIAKIMIENPSNLLMISLEEDKKIAKPRLTRSVSWSCWRESRPSEGSSSWSLPTKTSQERLNAVFESSLGNT